MTADRTPKPCLHRRGHHEHGKPETYRNDGCRCVPCSEAHRRYDKLSRYRTATGMHSYVPADRAREHVQRLLEVLTVGQIEQRSGVNRTSIRVLVGTMPGRPTSRRISRVSEAALLAVTDERVGPEQSGLVDGTGTRRRFRALVAIGWPADRLRARLNASSRTAWYLTSPQFLMSDPVRTSTRDAVRALYDELSLTLPEPSAATTRARRYAHARRWPPPLAFDDETIDDPAARPAHNARGHVVGGPRDLDLEERVLELTRAGLSAAQIALRLRTSQRQVVRIRSRNRKDDVA